MSWDERRRFNLTRPEADGLARLARAAVGRGAKITAVRRLMGGVDAATHALRIEPGGWFVLKRSWTTDPASLAGEWHRLRAAEPAPVATPVPVALDADGDWFGRPALLMTRLPGSSRLGEPLGDWIDELAGALAAIHAAPAGPAVAASIGRQHAGAGWRPAPAANLRRTPPVEGLIDVSLGLQADLDPNGAGDVLLHHDFHQGNVLTRRGRVTGVVDWNEACVGPSECDVAYASVDLAMVAGRRSSDRFVRAYRRASGRPLDDLARWQALWVVSDLRWVKYWTSSFEDIGASHLTLPVLRRRLRSFGSHLLGTI